MSLTLSFNEEQLAGDAASDGCAQQNFTNDSTVKSAQGDHAAVFGTVLNAQQATVDIREQPPLSLAFLGDGVLELLVRRRLVQTTRLQPGELHKRAVRMVSARGQAAALKELAHVLNEDELNLVRRGKNTSKATVAKHATSEEYRASTGLECLFGYLYATGQSARIDELFECYWAYFAADK